MAGVARAGLCVGLAAGSTVVGYRSGARPPFLRHRKEVQGDVRRVAGSFGGSWVRRRARLCGWIPSGGARRRGGARSR